MRRHQTHLFDIEVPDRFEKVLQIGQLLRCEQLTRDPHEGSTAEVTFWVGAVEFDHLDLPPDSAPPEVLDALLNLELARERESVQLPSDYMVSREDAPTRVEAVVKLAPDEWRPETGQVIAFEVFGDPPRVYTKFVLEFDWASAELYRDLAAKMLRSLAMHEDRLDADGLAAQAEERSSSFDEMPAEEREQIARQRRDEASATRGSASEAADETPALDLTDAPSTDTIEALLERHLAFDEADEGEIEVRIALLPEPLLLRVFSPSPSSAVDPTTRLLERLSRLGDSDRRRAAELLWEHCQLCFDTTDYGADGVSDEDFFGIHGPEDAWAERGPVSMTLDVQSTDRVELRFEPAWEQEHGCILTLDDAGFSTAS